MDQLKVVLEKLKKHHFWVLCGVILIAALIGWYSAASALSTQFTTNLGKVKSQHSEVTALISQDHANDDNTAKVIEKGKSLTDNVEAAWKKAYEVQKSRVLYWPEAVREINNLPDNADIPQGLRIRYVNFLEQEFPKLLKTVGALSPEEQQNQKAPARVQNRNKAGLPMRPGDRPAEGEAAKPAAPAMNYKVVWDSANQEQIRKTLDPGQPPTTPSVRTTQENLWVYRALVDIIAKVNGTAEFHYLAPIKKISELSIAENAGKRFAEGTAPGRILKPQVAAGTHPTNPVAPTAAPPAVAPAVQVSGTATEGRYVDAQGRPLPNGTPMIEFKRMPVYLKLLMDQREIPSLLAECVNSPLPIEVRQLRVNPSKGSTIVGQAAAGNRDNDVEASPHDQTVEIHGIVYIYKPPDRTKIGATVETVAGPNGTPVPTGERPTDD